jgi:hypothetical protein
MHGVAIGRQHALDLAVHMDEIGHVLKHIG